MRKVDAFFEWMWEWGVLLCFGILCNAVVMSWTGWFSEGFTTAVGIVGGAGIFWVWFSCVIHGLIRGRLTTLGAEMYRHAKPEAEEATERPAQEDRALRVLDGGAPRQ